MNSDNEEFVVFYNYTKHVEEDINDTIINASIASANDTTANDAQPLCSTEVSVACIRYYVEGVLLVPLCIFGVFGKYDTSNSYTFKNIEITCRYKIFSVLYHISLFSLCSNEYDIQGKNSRKIMILWKASNLF